MVLLQGKILAKGCALIVPSPLSPWGYTLLPLA